MVTALGETSAAEALRSYLERVRELAATSSEAFVLEHGQPWERRELVSYDVRLIGPEGQCYVNAQRALRRRPAWRYVEGMAADPCFGIALAHAWCADEAGLALELTAGWPADTVYFGVEFPRELVLLRARSARGPGSRSMFWAPEAGHPVLRTRPYSHAAALQNLRDYLARRRRQERAGGAGRG